MNSRDTIPVDGRFAFGLLHGFGFASALAEVGLPPSTIPVALLFFNVGVEIGQVLFVGAVLTVAGLATRFLRVRPPDWLGYVPPYAIGGLASSLSAPKGQPGTHLLLDMN